MSPEAAGTVIAEEDTMATPRTFLWVTYVKVLIQEYSKLVFDLTTPESCDSEEQAHSKHEFLTLRNPPLRDAPISAIPAGTQGEASYPKPKGY